MGGGLKLARGSMLVIFTFMPRRIYPVYPFCDDYFCIAISHPSNFAILLFCETLILAKSVSTVAERYVFYSKFNLQ